MSEEKKSFDELMASSNNEDLITTLEVLKTMKQETLFSQIEASGVKLNFLTKRILMKRVNDKVKALEQELKNRGVDLNENI